MRSRLVLTLFLLVAVAASANWHHETIDTFPESQLPSLPAINFSPETEEKLFISSVVYDGINNYYFWIHDFTDGVSYPNHPEYYEYQLHVDFGFDKVDPEMPIVFESFDTQYIDYWCWVEDESQWDWGRNDTIFYDTLHVSVESHRREGEIRLAALLWDYTYYVPQIYYMTYESQGHSITEMLLVDDPSATFGWPVSVYNPNDGNSIVIYNRNGNLYLKTEGDNFIQLYPIGDDVNCQTPLAAAAGETNLYVAFYDLTRQEIRVLYCPLDELPGGEWQELTSISGDINPNDQLALEVATQRGQDHPQLAFTRTKDARPFLHLALFGETVWQIDDLNDVSSSESRFLDLTLNEEGHPWIVYYTGTGWQDNSIELAYCDNFYPAPFDLLAPSDGSPVGSRPIFTWEPSWDFEDPDAVTYNVEIAIDENFVDSPYYFDAGSDTSYTPEEPLPGGTYYWRVIAKDDENGTYSTSEWSFTVSPGPAFDYDHVFLDTLSYGEPNRISCAFIDSTAVESCVLICAKGGTNPEDSTGWHDVEMIQDDDGTWFHELPAGEIDMSGLAYGFIARDHNGNESCFPDDFYTGGGRLLANTHAETLTTPADLPPGGSVADYRLVTCPMMFPEGKDDPVYQLGDDFGPYNPKNWRLFGWNAAAQDYVEYNPLSGNITLQPGPGYWLIVRRGADSLTFEDCASLKPDAANPFTVDLVEGWNLIGTPYFFDVDWKDCYTDDPDTIPQPPVGFFEGVYSYDVETLAAGSGYWVYAEGPDRLYIPAVRSGNPSAGVPSSTGTSAGYVGRDHDLSTTLSATGGLPGISLPQTTSLRGADTPPPALGHRSTGSGWGSPERWRLAFSLSDGVAADTFHVLGVDPTAGEYFDALERRKAPLLGGMPALWFEHEDWPSRRGHYATDLRRPFERGARWSFHAAAEVEAVLSWRIENGWPAGFGALLELPDGRVIDLLERNSLRLEPLLLRSGLPFTVHVGTADYLDGQFSARSFSLAQSYPNPSAGLVRIEYELPVAGRVELAVYDIAGRRVDTLYSGEQVAGRHAVAWDASAVAPGVYLYRLSGDEGSLTRRLIVDR